MAIAMVTWPPLNSGFFGSGEANTEGASGEAAGPRAEGLEVVCPEEARVCHILTGRGALCDQHVVRGAGSLRQARAPPRGRSAEMPGWAEGTEASAENGRRPHSTGRGMLAGGGQGGRGRGPVASAGCSQPLPGASWRQRAARDPPKRRLQGPEGAGQERGRGPGRSGQAGEAGLPACEGRWEVRLGRRP